MDSRLGKSIQAKRTVNDVQCYVPMKRKLLHLVAILSWQSRAGLSRRLSNTMDTEFCVAALEEATNGYGVPEIFNIDQGGGQFTSQEFTQVLTDAGVANSMDGKGRWLDNVFIERLWRSVKWECLYLRELETGSQTRRALGHWFHLYNEQRQHTSFDDRRPLDVYRYGQLVSKAA
jgi:putative transposase